MINSFSVLAWKDSGGTFFPDGATRWLSCSHINEGPYIFAMNGDEPIPLPTSTLPVTVPGTNFQHEQVGLPTGTVLIPATAVPLGYVAVYRIKDFQTLQITYVDAADYITNVGTCNDCCTAQ